MSASAKSLDLGYGASEDPPAKPLTALERAGISLREKADSWFPERQILIRGPGNVSALRLSQRAQLLAAGLVLFTLLALLLTSVGLCIAYLAESRAAAAAGRLQAALTLAQAQTARETAAYRLAAAQRDQALAQSTLARDIAVAKAVRARDLALAQAIHDRDLAVAQAIHDRDVAVAQAIHDRDVAVAQAQQLQAAAVAHANQVAASDSAALNALLQQTESTIGQVQTVIRSTGLDPSRLAAQPGPPSAANWAPSPSAMTNLPVTPLPLPPPPLPRRAAALNQAGINALSGGGNQEAGAPAPLSPPAGSPPAGSPPAGTPAPGFAVPPGLPATDAARADLLIGDLAWLSQLDDVLTQLPLTAPVAQTSISSGYGLRADPFTGAPEFHVGIDLPGPIGAPVYATAPGIVVFAGPSTGYGNLITIDHGYGLSTRYSHLDKILVKVGAAVTLHQEIGLMGNTGWSTGPHLLYETRVDGQPQNPLNFIKVNPYDVQN